MAHNVVYYDTSTNTIQQLSTADIDALSERVLRVMAAGTYTGTITIGTTNPIGTFTDTALVGNTGSSNVTIVSNVYTLSQITTTTLGASASPPQYMGLDTSVPNQTIIQQNLTTLNQLADEILTRMVAGTGGTNAYYLGTSAPADGATWVSLGSLLNTIDNLTVTVNNYRLWERSTSGAALTNKNPLELVSNELQAFTDAEVNALIKIIEERIVATGIGTYALQTSAPATGTWVNAGTITDTRQNIQVNTYTGEINYLNENAISYDVTYSTDSIYTGTVDYDSVDYATLTYQSAITYTLTYFGERPFSALYNSPIPQGYAAYSGPSYFGINATYDGPAPIFTFGGTPYDGPATQYGGPPLAFASFSGTDTFGATYVGAADYILTSNYSTAEYTVTYTLDVDYGGLPLLSYDGATYSGSLIYAGPINYDISVVASTQSTISTVTLWRRVG